MADSSKFLLGAADKGIDPGQAGTAYSKRFASVFRAGTRFELVVVSESGKNRESPYPPLPDSTIERRYRALTLDELLKVALAELAADAELTSEAPVLTAAIREAIFQAQILPGPRMADPDPVKVSMLASLERLLQTHDPADVEKISVELGDLGIVPELSSEKKREAMLTLLRRVLTLP